jgi:hypothetical protein
VRTRSDLSGLVFHEGGWTVDFVAAGLVVALSLLVVYGAKEGSLFNIGAPGTWQSPQQLMYRTRTGCSSSYAVQWQVLCLRL